MKVQRETTVELIFKSIGMETTHIPLNVIYTDNDGDIKVEYAEAALPAHAFINDQLKYSELKLLINCPIRRAA